MVLVPDVYLIVFVFGEDFFPEDFEVLPAGDFVA